MGKLFKPLLVIVPVAFALKFFGYQEVVDSVVFRSPTFAAWPFVSFVEMAILLMIAKLYYAGVSLEEEGQKLTPKFFAYSGVMLYAFFFSFVGIGAVKSGYNGTLDVGTDSNAYHILSSVGASHMVLFIVLMPYFIYSNFSLLVSGYYDSQPSRHADGIERPDFLDDPEEEKSGFFSFLTAPFRRRSAENQARKTSGLAELDDAYADSYDTDADLIRATERKKEADARLKEVKRAAKRGKRKQ